MFSNAEAENNHAAQIEPPIITGAPWRIRELRVMDDFHLWVKFNDGTAGTVALSAFINSPSAGVFSSLRNPSVFSQATLCYGAVCWPGELDLAPDAMHDAIARDGEWVIPPI